MARYVTRKEDAFGAAIKAELSELGSDTVIRHSHRKRLVRRPLHAMELHEDTYSTITVRSASGGESEALINTSRASRSGDFMSSTTSNLIIQSVSESREEKQQIVQTFGEDFVYFFGERPVMTQFTAILPDSVEFQYAAEFWRNYEQVLRGTSLVTRNLRAYVSVGRKVYEGYLVSATTQRQAEQPRVIQLTFTLYTTRTSYLDALRNQRVSAEEPYLWTDMSDYIIGGYADTLQEEGKIEEVFAEVLDIVPSIKRGSRSFSLITGEYLSREEEKIGNAGGFNRPSIASKPKGTADFTENFDWESPSAPSTSIGDVVSTLMTGAFVLGAAVEIVATAQEEIADLATTIRGVVADPAGAFINSAAVNSVTAGLAGRIGRGELQVNKPTTSNPRILLTSPGTSGTFDGVLDI